MIPEITKIGKFDLGSNFETRLLLNKHGCEFLQKVIFIKKEKKKKFNKTTKMHHLAEKVWEKLAEKVWFFSHVISSQSWAF